MVYWAILGSWLQLSNSFIGWFTVLVAIVMVLLGLNIIGLTPSLSKFGIRFPKSTGNTWNKLKKSRHKSAPLLLGAFSFFLPCGFTQSMQLFAISTGSFWKGALSLSLFALGTLPILIILGITASSFKQKKMVVLQKVIGMVVILFAVYTLSAGLALAGVNFDIGLDKKYGETTKTATEQVVKMEVDYYGYKPNVFTIKKDVPVKWIVNVKRMTGCTNEIIIPSLNISKKLVVGENIINFTPKQEGDLMFSCWMGMVRGKFIVESGGVSVTSANTSDPTLAESYSSNGLTSGAQCDGSCGGGCGSGCNGGDSTTCSINN